VRYHRPVVSHDRWPIVFKSNVGSIL